MPVTRIKNNQITDLTVNAAAKLQDFSVTSGKIANNLTYDSSLTITGNLTVQGNVTAIDTQDLVVEDPLILLARDQSGSPALDIGFIGKRGTEDNIAFVWDESADQFVCVFTDSEVTNTTININSYASLQVLDLTAANLDITGNIDFSGNIVGNVIITGNVDADNFNAVNEVTGSAASFTGNIDGANVNATTNVTGVTVTASGNLEGNNAVITNDVSTTTVSASGNIDGANINATTNVTAVTVTASGNLEGNNAVITNDVATATVTATGNVSGSYFVGNIDGDTGTFTGNVSGSYFVGNIDGDTGTFSGNVSGSTFLGNIDGDTGTFTGNVTGDTFVGNIDGDTGTFSGNVTGDTFVGNIDGDTGTFSGNVTGDTFVGNIDGDTGTFSGNVSAGNLSITGSFDVASISATGNITGNNVISNNDVTTATVTATGNVDGANLNATTAVTAAAVTATGNVSGNNIVSTNDVTTATVTATGNIDGANVNATTNVTATTVTASGNVDAGTAVNADLVAGTSLQIVSTGDLDLEPSGNISVSGVLIRDMADPVSAQDAATKQYVDDAVSSGIHIHTPVDVETPVALPTSTYAQGGNTFTVNETIAGNTVVFTTAANLQVNDQLWFDNSFNGVVGNVAYFVVSTPNTSAAVLSTNYNGSPVANITSASGLTESVRVNSGVGATLTATANGALTVDGFSVSAGNRVLVYQQSTQYENGVYAVTDAGNVSAPWILTRATDSDRFVPDTNDGLDQGSYYYVKSGDTGAGESYVLTQPSGPFIIGLANIEFTQFSASQVYSANTQAGLDLTGTEFSAKTDNDTTAFDGGGNIIVKAGANLVTPNIGNATGNSLSLSGNGLLSATTVQASGNVLAGNLNSNAAVTAVTMTATGNVNGNNLVSTNDVTTATVTATGNVSGANLNATTNVTGVTVTATGNINGNNLVSTNDVTTATVTATGNVSGANINATTNVTGVTISASGNLVGNNAVITNDVSSATVTATGNVSGANVNATTNVTGVTITASGNLEGNNAVITNDVSTTTVSASGNIDGANVNATTNVTGVTVTATGNVNGNNLVSTNDVTTATVTATGNIDGANVNATTNVTGVTVTASGNLVGNNAVLTNNLSAASGNFSGNVTAVNFFGNISGNVNAAGANTEIQFNDDLTLAGDANFTFDKSSGQVAVSGSLVVDNVVVNGQNITSLGAELTVNDAGDDVDFRVEGSTDADLFIVDAGSDSVLIGTASPTTGAALKIGTTNSFMPPVGNLAQRPGTPAVGMLRYSTTEDNLEVYTSASGWITVGENQFTVITADSFTGDGSTLVFTLSEDSTTAATIVSINGVVQIPTTAYSVAGNVLTFTEAPESSDAIDARLLTTTTTVTALRNTSGNAEVSVLDTADTVQILGNLLPETSNTYNLGSSSLRWNELFLEGSTITLGNVVIKNTSGNTIGFFGPDGTTPATLDANVEVVGDAIESGTSNVSFAGSNGNILLVSGGNTTGVITATGANITGTLNSSGNANVGNLGTAGLIVATGNITGGNLSGTSIVGTLTTAAQTNITSVGTLGSLTVTGNITGGNLSGTSIVGTLTTAAQTNITSVGTLGSLTVTGNITGGNLNTGARVVATGNVTGGNLTTAGRVDATGNITGGNLSGTSIVGTLTTAAQTNITSVGTLGSLTVTGNITGGNLITAGLVSLSSITKTGSNGVGNIGSSTSVFNTVFAKATSAQYADLAEMYEADAQYEPGTVLCFGGAKEVTLCDAADSTRVAGVVSTNPSYLMNSGQAGDNVVAVALTGRVPCRVTGAVRKGDLMVSTRDGRARANNDAAVGTVIGKALADFDGSDGLIEVVVGRV